MAPQKKILPETGDLLTEQGASAKEVPAKGRRKRTATDNPLDQGPKKRAKTVAIKVPKTKVTLVKSEVRLPISTRNKSTATIVKWRPVVNSAKESKCKASTSTAQKVSPRIWTGSRDELLAMLPEMAGSKCFNGISWYKYHTPLLVLDQTNYCFDIERQEKQPLCLNLVTTRSFVSALPKSSNVVDPAMPAISDPQQTHQPVSKVQRKAARYRIPKSLAGNILDSKVEFIRENLPNSEVIIKAEPVNTPNVVLSAIAAEPSNQFSGDIPPDLLLTTPDCPTTAEKISQPEATHPSIDDPKDNMSGTLLPLSRAESCAPETKDLAAMDHFLDTATQAIALKGTLPQLPTVHSPYQKMIMPEASSSKVTLDVMELSEAENISLPCASIMMDETSDEMNLASVNDLPSVIGVETPALLLEEFIPSPLPDEINALVESYLFGRPVSVIVARDRLEKSWGIKVGKEFGYVMLGFFRILGIQETRLPSEGMNMSKLSDGLCAGQVQWRFNLEWAPGGEEIILPQHPKASLNHPWWAPTVEDVSVSGSSDKDVEDKEMLPISGEEPKEPEIRYPTTPKYRAARLGHHEYQFRHCPLSDAYDSVVPEQVLAPYGRRHSDRIFPRGWLCTKCGRMNFQRALRHRSCPSSACKDEPAPVEPYHYDLYWMRDPQERLPINCPLNTYPPGATMERTNWEDGTQTYGYYVNGNPGVFIKHIFLSNVPELQKPISTIMEKIQLTVPLTRPTLDNHPYFYHTAKCPAGTRDPTKVSWRGTPEVINEAKAEVVSRASSFAGIPDKNISVKIIKVVAWITEGSKRGNEVIRAKSKCVILLAMGCTTIMTVTPRATTDVDSKVKSETQGPVDEGVESGWVALNGKLEDEPTITLGAEGGPKKRGPVKKVNRPSFVLSLYHGDMVVFYGDDFEYSFKRDGTSFMLFASHDEIV